MSKDYYRVLGIEKYLGRRRKKAYRKLAHQYHPDKAGGNEQKFKEINEAYQVWQQGKRSQYDRFGRTFDGAGSPGGFGGFNFDPSQFGDLGDIFGDVFGFGFGGSSGERKTYRGSDLETRIDISLEEAFRGVKKPLRIGTLVRCETCGGQGHFPKEGFTVCAACDGRGEIREIRSSFFGAFSRVRTCGKCSGLGKIPKKICAFCGGGRVKGVRETEVTLAPGISDGQIIKISGLGEAGERGAVAGDLYLGVRVKPHPVFARVGDDLVMRRVVPLLDILLGKAMAVETLSGKNRSRHPGGF